MKRLANIKKYTATGLGVSALALSISMANAAPVTVELCTGITAYDPGGANVPMWGFALNTGGVCGTPSVPGPEIAVNEGDVVTINLTNNLAVPVSLLVTGHNVDDGGVNAGPDPVFNGNRVRSLFAEAAAAGGTATYVVTAKAGSFIYHSATHQQVQVQMGLYGAMASSPLAPTYDNAITMFYSEIDPALHNAVADGTYGTAAGPTSTIVYKPQYFLVNGAASDGSAPIAAGDTGQDILVRMFNAGLKSRTMQTLGTNMTIVAENGSATPYGKTRITADVHALGTTDVIINSATAGDFRLYDRRLAHSNGVTAGGINSTLTIAAGAGAPVAGDDVANVAEDTPTLINVVSNDGVVDAATVAVVTDPVHGSAASNGDGTVTYSPNADYNGADSFTYTVDNVGGVTSNVATVAVTVTAVNDAPVSNDDEVNIVEGTLTTLPVLANDSDVDGDALSIASVDTTGTLGSVVINGTTVDYTPAIGAVAGSTDSFTYIATDGVGNSVSATCVITIVAPAGNIAPVAEDETVTWSRAAGAFVNPVDGSLISTTLDILDNDSDADGTLDPASVALSETSKRDKNLANGDQGSSVLLLLSGDVSYTPPASGGGTDVFTYTVADNLGEVSNTATVRINLVK